MQLPDLKKIHINPKYVRIGAIVLASLFVLLLIGGFIAYSKREALLQKAIAKAKEKARSTYNLDLEIGSARFTGLSTVAFSDITIVPDHRDSLLNERVRGDWLRVLARNQDWDAFEKGYAGLAAEDTELT